MRVLVLGAVLTALIPVGADFARGQSEPVVIKTDALISKTQGSKARWSFVLIDVRSWVEFQDEHIDGAIHIPSDAVETRLPEKIHNKRRELIFYCGGPRCPNSRQAALKAMDLGYRKVEVYAEGLLAWTAAKQSTRAGAPLPVIDPVFVSSDEIMPVVQNKTKDAVIVDVRNRNEFAAFHLNNSINIPLDELEDKEKRLSGKKVVFVCHAGGQSIVAARLLSKSGRKDMCVLKGGLAGWQSAHLPLIEGKRP